MGGCLSFKTKLQFNNHNNNHNNNKPSSFNILLLGLNGAGKTEILHKLWNKSRNDFNPTNGCQNHKISYQQINISLTELGGSSDIRDIWKYYYQQAHGAIFLIDCTDHERLLISRNLLLTILLESKLSGKPILILGNKQDEAQAIDCLDLCTYLDIDRLANLSRTPCFVSTIGRNDYGELESGMKWLLKTIVINIKKILNQNEYYKFMEKSGYGKFTGENHNNYNKPSSERRKKKIINTKKSIERPKTAPYKISTQTFPNITKVSPINFNLQCLSKNRTEQTTLDKSSIHFNGDKEITNLRFEIQQFPRSDS